MTKKNDDLGTGVKPQDDKGIINWIAAHPLAMTKEKNQLDCCAAAGNDKEEDTWAV